MAKICFWKGLKGREWRGNPNKVCETKDVLQINTHLFKKLENKMKTMFLKNFEAYPRAHPVAYPWVNTPWIFGVGKTWLHSKNIFFYFVKIRT